MANFFKELSRVRRSIMGALPGGDVFADITDPHGANVAKQDKKASDAAAQAAAIAEALENAPAAAEPALQTLIEPEPMPTRDTQRLSQRRSRARQLQRRGRQSTILTSYDDGLGGET